MLVYRVMSEDLRTVSMALLRVGRVSLICSNNSLSIEDDWQVDSIYMDFSKVFDRVRRCLLLKKM
jgi:hypothetical protein